MIEKILKKKSCFQHFSLKVDKFCQEKTDLKKKITESDKDKLDKLIKLDEK